MTELDFVAEINGICFVEMPVHRGFGWVLRCFLVVQGCRVARQFTFKKWIAEHANMFGFLTVRDGRVWVCLIV